jgi:hypothetical protein
MIAWRLPACSTMSALRSVAGELNEARLVADVPLADIRREHVHPSKSLQRAGLSCDIPYTAGKPHVTSPRGFSAAPTHARMRSSRLAGALGRRSTGPRVARMWASSRTPQPAPAITGSRLAPQLPGSASNRPGQVSPHAAQRPPRPRPHAVMVYQSRPIIRAPQP